MGVVSYYGRTQVGGSAGETVAGTGGVSSYASPSPITIGDPIYQKLKPGILPQAPYVPGQRILGGHPIANPYGEPAPAGGPTGAFDLGQMALGAPETADEGLSGTAMSFLFLGAVVFVAWLILK